MAVAVDDVVAEAVVWPEEAWLRMIGVFSSVSTEWMRYSGVCTATR